MAKLACSMGRVQPPHGVTNPPTQSLTTTTGRRPSQCNRGRRRNHPCSPGTTVPSTLGKREWAWFELSLLVIMTTITVTVLCEVISKSYQERTNKHARTPVTHTHRACAICARLNGHYSAKIMHARTHAHHAHAPRTCYLSMLGTTATTPRVAASAPIASRLRGCDQCPK